MSEVGLTGRAIFEVKMSLGWKKEGRISCRSSGPHLLVRCGLCCTAGKILATRHTIPLISRRHL